MQMLAAISLIAPAMLAGGALLSLPIIAHLLNRRARREVVFPTVRFLVASSALRSSITRVRRWVLLALRCLAVALLVLAFARPTWFGADSGGNPETGVAVVFVVDTSASVGRIDGGVTELSSLRGAGQRAIDALRPGTDVAEIVEASDAPKAVFGRLSPNLPAIKDALDKLTPGFGRADFHSAMARAGELLATHPGPRRIVILSDLQTTNWQELLEVSGGAGVAQMLPDGTQVTIAAPASSAADNIAVTSLRVAPSNPTVGHPVEAIALVRNFGGQARKVPVTLTVDTDVGVSRTVELAAFSQVEVSIDVTFQARGEHRLTASIPDDVLLADNRAYAVTRVVDQLPVVIIGDDDPSAPGSASFFLRRALAPRGGEGDTYALSLLPASGARPAAIRDAGVVVLSDPQSMSPESAGALVQYVRAGGSLVVFCGQGPVADTLAAIEKAAGTDGLMPCVVGSPRIVSRKEEPWTIAQGEWSDPMLRIFDERGRAALGAAHFTRIFPSTSMAPGAVTLLTFNDGTPALTSRRIGEGSVVLAHFSPAAAGSDIARTGAFVALVHSVLDGLPSRRDARQPVTVGQPIVRRFPAPPSAIGVQVIGPDDHAIQADRTSAGDFIEIATERTARPGLYRFVAAERTIGWEAVNLDQRESDLRRSDAQGVRAALERSNISTAVAEGGAAAPVLEVAGRPLWHFMILVASMALGVEMLLLGVWKR